MRMPTPMQTPTRMRTPMPTPTPGTPPRSGFGTVEEMAPLVAALADGQAPVPLWRGRLSGPESTGRVATRGLYPLLGAEIEVSSSQLEPDSAYELALAVAMEILDNSKPPAHGELIACDKESAFRVRHRPYGEDGAIPAVVLTHVALPDELDVAAGAA